MLSANTAKELKLNVNDKILIYFIRPDGTLRPDKLTITGIYKTGIEEYDKTFAIGDIKLIQRLNRDNSEDSSAMNEIGGYEIFLNDYHKMDQAVDEIYNMDDFPETWNTVSAKDISPNIFDWLNMQDVTRNVLIVFMVIVAVINLITCLIILVLERLRMIGILKSLGATDWTVQKIFLRHSVIITITGIILGAAIRAWFTLVTAGNRFYQTPGRSILHECSSSKNCMVAGRRYLWRHITGLFFGADDTFLSRKKNTTGKGDTVQVAGC